MNYKVECIEKKYFPVRYSVPIVDINAHNTLGGEGGGGRSISVECIRGKKEGQVGSPHSITWMQQ